MFRSLSLVSKSTTKGMFLYVIILLCQIIYIPYIVIVLYTLYWCDHFPYPYGFAILYGSTEINYMIWYDSGNRSHWTWLVYCTLLTVHFGAILVNNLLDALIQCIYLFHFCTCFEQPSAHHQENQLFQYVIWYISLCVGDWYRHTRQSSTQSDKYQMMYWYNWYSWWWALGCSKHVEKWNK